MSTRARDHFTSTLNGNAKLVHHGGPGVTRAKIEIRRHVLNHIGAANARVFDAFAGEGLLYQGVWREAAAYVGCDLDWYRDDERTCFVADNRRVMRCFDLRPYSIFDFDGFGSCYEQLTILAARRPVAPDERIGIAMTDGSGLRLKMGWIPDALALMSGLRRHMPGVARNQADIIDRALAGLCRRMNVKILNRWQARGKSASSLYYIGLILQGLEPPE